MLTENVQIAILSLISGVAVALIGVFGGRKITKETDTPKNRADDVFNGYDHIIAALRAEVDRKDMEIAELLTQNRALTKELSICRHDHKYEA